MEATQQYSVIKTTTERLSDALNEILMDGAGVESFNWVGGRDWVIVARGYNCRPKMDEEKDNLVGALHTVRHYLVGLSESPTARIDHLGDRISTVVTVIDLALSGKSEGLVDNMDRRHARFDSSPLLPREYASDITPASFASLVDPEIQHGDLIYGRYDTNRVPTGNKYTAWIENYAKSWIIFLGEHGSPSLYYPRRDEMGGVIGSPINLAS